MKEVNVSLRPELQFTLAHRQVPSQTLSRDPDTNFHMIVYLRAIKILLMDTKGRRWAKLWRQTEGKSRRTTKRHYFPAHHDSTVLCCLTFLVVNLVKMQTSHLNVLFISSYN